MMSNKSMGILSSADFKGGPALKDETIQTPRKADQRSARDQGFASFVCSWGKGVKRLLWMDNILHHARIHWNDSIPQRKYQQTKVSTIVSKWCSISSIHTVPNLSPEKSRGSKASAANLDEMTEAQGLGTRHSH